ncbi:sulfurtransferase FdhD [Thalassotalea loyana]|uniref:Sulfur carrier protein FdhD n=1 Tax=Thalassotalea loyana TaxID=280483 RepID=A0ABQ6HDX5_9GAMM|nr:formate dehydrogenase accessory sulfurtransferase FdhD [Thalassotalea loyana]GLX86291.1 sulfurtransferase FdhD [Thalassotalea loyana]
MKHQGQQQENSTRRVTKRHYSLDARMPADDIVAVEAPLLIVIATKEQLLELATIMRTPGDDVPLSLGFLFSEHIITSKDDVLDVKHSDPNEITISLAEHVVVDDKYQSRQFTSYSGCGICGKSSIKQLALKATREISRDQHWLPFDRLIEAAQELRAHQHLFQQTGSVHGAALLTLSNSMFSFIDCKEDVGRHNAVDKLIGKHLLTAQNRNCILLLSGRISFELVQKAVMAGVCTIAAIGAPSSLALETAKQFDLTLIGFITAKQANIYCGDWRLSPMTVENSDGKT